MSSPAATDVATTTTPTASTPVFHPQPIRARIAGFMGALKEQQRLPSQQLRKQFKRVIGTCMMGIADLARAHPSLVNTGRVISAIDEMSHAYLSIKQGILLEAADVDADLSAVFKEQEVAVAVPKATEDTMDCSDETGIQVDAAVSTPDEPGVSFPEPAVFASPVDQAESQAAAE